MKNKNDINTNSESQSEYKNRHKIPRYKVYKIIDFLIFANLYIDDILEFTRLSPNEKYVLNNIYLELSAIASRLRANYLKETNKRKYE